eukprot:CAMPEP_0175452390 /NCGR_PEP_ID=MMETSP0095-20121207/63386_1 /TAXON_ID=311494 /ORGANISM="Alexandrium monilatum, Strain CCMP3105" /LENGTH=49 /DNA_ID= /DNA_START= /DNA_END= /DNA_ORIENTATION=
MDPSRLSRLSLALDEVKRVDADPGKARAATSGRETVQSGAIAEEALADV